MGVNANSTISFTLQLIPLWQALCYSVPMAYQQVSPTMGVMLGKAFVAAVLGIGSIPGAVIMALLLASPRSLLLPWSVRLAVMQSSLTLDSCFVVKPTGLFTDQLPRKCKEAHD